MTAEEFILKKINPKNGSLKTGIMNNDYVAQLMEEYCNLKKVELNTTTNADIAYNNGYRDGWNVCVRSTILNLSKQFINLINKEDE